MLLFQRDDTLDEDEDDCEFVLAGEGGVVRSTLLCGEKGREQGRRRQGGVLVEEGGEVEHVPDSERPFWGRGLWLRLACGIGFQR